MNIWLEVFGWIGTAIVLSSMLMTNINKLRIVNITGSVVSAAYAALCNTWPVVFLNVGMIIINVAQLIRVRKRK